MSYPLKSLHQLLCVHLAPQDQMFTKPVPDAVEKKFSKALNEIEALQVSILESIISVGTPAAPAATVKACQVGCTGSLNGIYHQRRKLRRTEGVAVGWDTLYEDIEHGLLVFLQYMQEHFPSQFDKAQTLPLTLREQYRSRYGNRIKVIEEEITAAGIESQLQHLILKPLLYFLSSGEASLTYASMEYIEAYLKKVECVAAVSSAQSGIWMDTLVEMNNNDPSFIKYLAQKLRMEEEEKGTTDQKLAMWSAERSRFGALHGCSAYSFHPHLPSAKEAILGFIEKETDSILKKLQAEAIKPLVMTASAPSEPVITTSLSMTQMAVMLRLFNECSLIKSDNQTAVFRGLAQVIRTDKTTKLSADSLRSKYYSPERAAISIVKDYLFQMLNHLKGM